MRLNPDCIRDILLAAEEEIGFRKEMRYPGPESLNKYSTDEVFYHINQCELSGLVVSVRRTLDPTYYIKDLSPKGHEFLANIRSDTVWNKTKENAKKVGSFSLDTLTKIAVNVISALIKDNI
jgi:hypothetical protein